MQKSFYCIFMKAPQGLPMSNFVEQIFSNIQSSTQTSGDSSASFMYSFDAAKETVVGIYSSDSQTKMPSYLTMYSNSLNNEANMIGAVFDTIDSYSSAYDQTIFKDRVAKSMPFYIELLNNVSGTDTDPNINKPAVATSEPTDDIFAGIENEEIMPEESVKHDDSTQNKSPGSTNREVVLLEEILDKLNDVVVSLSVLNDKVDRIEAKSESDNTTTTKTSSGTISKEIENIGGIPEIPTYTDESIPEKNTEPEVAHTEDKVEQPSTTKPVTEETVNSTPDEGLEVTTPSEASIYTPEKSSVTEQSNNSPAPIVNTNLTPDVAVTEEAEEKVGTESLQPTMTIPETKLDKIKKLMQYTDGTESSLHNYIISNSHMLDKSDIELYCTYDFEESINSNNLVKLDRVTSVKRQLETKMI